MHDVIKLFKKHGIKVEGLKKQGNVQIVNTDQGIYSIKKRKREDVKDIYKYLETKNFNYFISPINDEVEYEILPYIDNVLMDNQDAVIDMVHVVAVLHNKTTYYKTISTGEIKETYETIIKNINIIENYYNNLRWAIEETKYLLPSRYLLLRNLSIIFICLDKTKYYINKWYDLAKDKESKKVALIHKNLELEHFLKNKDMYLINWEKAEFDSPVYDLNNFYRNNYLILDFGKIFSLYNSKYRLDEEEIYLFFSILLQPEKIEFDLYEINNTKLVYNLTSYLLKVNDFILEYNSTTTNNKPS